MEIIVLGFAAMLFVFYLLGRIYIAMTGNHGVDYSSVEYILYGIVVVCLLFLLAIVLFGFVIGMELLAIFG